MAEHRLVATRQYRRMPVAGEGELRAPDGKDAAPNRMEASRREPMVDRHRAEAKREQLPGDHTVLALDQPPDDFVA